MRLVLDDQQHPLTPLWPSVPINEIQSEWQLLAAVGLMGMCMPIQSLAQSLQGMQLLGDSMCPVALLAVLCTDIWHKELSWCSQPHLLV